MEFFCFFSVLRLEEVCTFITREIAWKKFKNIFLSSYLYKVLNCISRRDLPSLFYKIKIQSRKLIIIK